MLTSVPSCDQRELSISCTGTGWVSRNHIKRINNLIEQQKSIYLCFLFTNCRGLISELKPDPIVIEKLILEV